ncbi:hypothetical protein MUK42_22752 [Musa troglodytarum]|uniref:Uncharacterized protein n=1 Tax=Musa troglodytarum TaxID=320322 RepID=A0A9E7ETR8_9LILI|nr:hypothetical protein MUK42_22752 [Musa troglodytarum]
MSSTHSGKYSALNYDSGNEQESETSSHHGAISQNSTKFCADGRHLLSQPVGVEVQRIVTGALKEI